MFDQDDNEILDVVNENDEVVGTIRRADMMSLTETPGRYLRTIEIFVQRPNGDIYLPRRSKEKKIAPGGYDLSAAGHILSGESYEKACLREIKEETGINANPEEILFISKVPPSTGLFYFRMLYLLRTDQVPKLSPEHTESVWVAPDSLEEIIRNDVPTKETLTMDIPILRNFLASGK